MATCTKNKKASAMTDQIESEKNFCFGRKIGNSFSRLEKGKQPDIHHHVIQQ